MRLDGDIQLSYFALLTPVWILAIPMIGFCIVKGLAAPNSRASKCEKAVLSILVPLGFLVSMVLAILYAEGTIMGSGLAPLFMPQVFSLICLYLYLRCLVKPVKIYAK